jgi:hypothetical protein
MNYEISRNVAAFIPIRAKTSLANADSLADAIDWRQYVRHHRP